MKNLRHSFSVSVPPYVYDKYKTYLFIYLSIYTPTLRETDLLILKQIFDRGRHERLGVRVQSLSLLLEGWSLYR